MTCRHRPIAALAAVWLTAACSVGGGEPEPVSYADRFEEFDQLGEGALLLVPVDPPPGYTLFNALSARTWVPAGFESGQVPTVTLCPIAQGMEAAGTCYGTEQGEKVAALDLVVEGQRLVVVAQDGTGHAADDMIEDWRSAAYTSDWRSLDWVDQPATAPAPA